MAHNNLPKPLLNAKALVRFALKLSLKAKASVRFRKLIKTLILI